tara:strand:- start:36 stop:1061 length:1026 start_codon:yes stop_codon:yes gene_type:complete
MSENKVKSSDWHAQQEDILKDWSEQSSCYRWMHERSYQIYKKSNMRYSIPVIVISTITGTANFAQGSFPAGAQVWAPLIIGTLNLAAGLITTIAQFLRVSELLEGHRAASIAYAKLGRSIAVELSLPANERSMKGIEYIKQCRTDIDRLIEQSPSIPPEILADFNKSILSVNKNNPVGEIPEFSVPPILKLEAINVFRAEKHLEDLKLKEIEIKEKERQYRNSIIEEENHRIQKIIQEHEKTKNDLLGNFNIQNKLKMIEDKEKEIKKMDDKRNSLSLSSITKRMTKFANILDADSSSDESEPSPKLFDMKNMGLDASVNLSSVEQPHVELTITDASNNKL